MVQDLLSLNWQIFEALNQPAGHEPLLDPAMIFGASDVLFVLPLVLLALWLGLARWAPAARHATMSAASNGARGVGQRLVLLSCLAVALALASNVLLSHIIYEPRPFVSHPRLVHQLIPHVADASFPSDHTAVAAAIATVFLAYLLGLERERRALRGRIDALAVAPALQALVRLVVPLAVLAVVIVAYVGVARVYVGVHYPGDIAGGAVCGMLAGAVASYVRPLAEPVLGPVVRLAEALRLA